MACTGFLFEANGCHFTILVLQAGIDVTEPDPVSIAIA
jgi:hypothetical protein